MGLKKNGVLLEEKQLERSNVDELAKTGDVFALENMTRLKEEVNVMKMNINETTSQYKLLKQQVEAASL